ncbi:MAG: hypothetical protein HC806_04810 [Anaerolineae bacterium]|nr:hypothetical protein [Anaerolineae bacterium]
MTYTWAGNSASGNAFRLRPINALGGSVPDFQPANPRPETAPQRRWNFKCHRHEPIELLQHV